MDGESKKRKKQDDQYAVQENRENEEEDENVDKFFALIRSTREVKERLLSMAAGTSREFRRGGDGDGEGGRKNLMVHESIPAALAPEDFMKVEDRHRRPPPPPPPLDLSIGLQSQSRAYDKAAEEAPEDGGGGGDDHDLDLKLSL